MSKRKHSESIKMLFIGNSFTQRNDLPGLLAQMAVELDLRIKPNLISVGGASLRTCGCATVAAGDSNGGVTRGLGAISAVGARDGAGADASVSFLTGALIAGRGDCVDIAMGGAAGSL